MWQSLRILALICMVVLTGCNEGEDAPASPPFGNQTAKGQSGPLLYEITNAEGDVEGWILGTIHALPDGSGWRTPRIDQIIADSDRLLVEIADLEDRRTIDKTFRRMARTPGLPPLSDRVSTDLRAPLNQMIEQSGTAPLHFTEMETWAAALSLARVGAAGKPRNGVDRFLLHEFRGRDVHGFELPSEQLGIFDQLPEDDQRDFLDGTVREWIASRENPGWLTKAWLDGDIVVLERATHTGIMADPQLRDALLLDRNDRWMPTLIDNLAQTERLLVAVGTGHIVGPAGLPALLMENGYTVRRVE